MTTTKIRRQNASCDPCRHSKKRCVLDANEGSGSDISCQNCTRLGHTCTFNFATGRQVRKRQARRSSSELSAHAHLPVFPGAPNVIPPDTTLDSFIVPNFNEDSRMTQGTHTNDIAWTDLDHDGLTFLSFDDIWDNNFSVENDTLRETTNSTLQEKRLHNITEAATINSYTSSQDLVTQISASHNYCIRNSSSDSWHRGPTRLLNSTTSNALLSQQLFHVYDTMMLGLASRYLAYNSNQFASHCKYGIKQEVHAEQALNVSCQGSQAISAGISSVDAQQNQLQPDIGNVHSVESAAKCLEGVTLIGVARFLDNFGSLYGNHLTKTTRLLDEETFRSVVLAFALQFGCTDNDQLKEISSLPGETASKASLPGTNTSAFTAAWFSAHSNLTRSLCTQSFTHLNAILIFHMVALPKEARLESRLSTSPAYFLKHGLLQLQTLTTLVEAFCSQLHAESMYRVLLESSHEIFCWFAYVRDTVASVVSGSDCVLADAAESAPDVTILTPPPLLSSPILDNVVAETCQRASRHVFSLFRQVSHVNRILELNSQSLLRGAVADLISLMETVDTFHAMYDGWLDRCLSTFLQMSIQSKQFAGFLVLFWNFALLRVVETIRNASRVVKSDIISQRLATATSYQDKAVAALITISKRMSNPSMSEDVRLSDSSEQRMRLISHHANHSLTVLALTKAIEYVIHQSMSRTSKSHLHRMDSLPPLGLAAKVRPLLSCLIDLQQTVSGGLVAGPAVQGLCSQYGDVLLDCWDLEAVDSA